MAMAIRCARRHGRIHRGTCVIQCTASMTIRRLANPEPQFPPPLPPSLGTIDPEPEVGLKMAELTAVPSGVVTETDPLGAPLTKAMIWVPVAAVMLKAVPAIVTEWAEARSFPVMVSPAPLPPPIGLKPVIVGAWTVV